LDWLVLLRAVLASLLCLHSNGNVSRIGASTATTCMHYATLNLDIRIVYSRFDSSIHHYLLLALLLPSASDSSSLSHTTTCNSPLDSSFHSHSHSQTQGSELRPLLSRSAIVSARILDLMGRSCFEMPTRYHDCCCCWKLALSGGAGSLTMTEE
jgi:hypothetical protein